MCIGIVESPNVQCINKTAYFYYQHKYKNMILQKNYSGDVKKELILIIIIAIKMGKVVNLKIIDKVAAVAVDRGRWRVIV